MNNTFDNAQTDKEALARYGESLTHAWTVRHPFALAVATGIKPIENKKERPPMALIGKLIGIHAGLQWARPEDLPSWPKALHPLPRMDDPRLTYGALIGVARLVGVVRHSVRGFELMRGRSVGEAAADSLAYQIRPWWRGPWGWLLEEAELLPEPIPMRGQQGLWRIQTPDGWLYDGPPGARGNGAPYYTVAAEWALEQWRKAREGA